MADGVTGLILAGGRSRRMGRPKAFLPWGNATLIEHLLEQLRPVTDELIIVVKDRRPFQHLDARVIEDVVPQTCALAGLYTGLRAASFPRCFACGCDAPFLNQALVRFLIEESHGVDLVIPETPQGMQPLHAVYARSALRAIEEQLRKGDWDLHGLAMTAHGKCVEAGIIAQYDPGGLSFFNLNTPEDYRRACEIMGMDGSS